MGDFDAALGGRKNEDQVPEEDSGQDEEAQQVRPDVDRLVVKQSGILIENIIFQLCTNLINSPLLNGIFMVQYSFKKGS